MQIIIIGSGGVATNLGRLFQDNGLTITQILGRTESSTKKLAELLNCAYTIDTANLRMDGSLYIIAIQDSEIPVLLSQLEIPGDAMIVHTAGGVSIDVFKPFRRQFSQYGVLYPLQSLRKETVSIPEIPFYLDANDAKSKAFLEKFAAQARLNYRWADDKMRMQLHVAAVFCSNYPNYLYTLAENFCKKEGLDFSSLLPVITETTNRMSREKLSPALLQTGPAIRNDLSTIDKHLNILYNDTEAREVYQFLTEKIMESSVFPK